MLYSASVEPPAGAALIGDSTLTYDGLCNAMSAMIELF